ncbi:glutamate--cysteine ligase [Halobacterium sp. R2-5]|uniref:glutamate--cysteine ligase n=1 Tax=Halobacterium sp. R2-5 TaxID=2715751 RepID=UPI0014222E4D|nr:glutamate--cysteine ligase [Halobacterium sp. R2-5]NIB99568.1 glutamate--cysteine ligase [Halobacterium sp. R2-5]
MTLTTGVELELWVVDQYGNLSDGRHVADAHDRIEPEFVPPLLEAQTEPRASEAALRRDLQEVLRAAIRKAEIRDQHLVPLGTPLTAAAADADTERGRLFERIYGDGVRSAKNCAGTHVHFEKGDPLEQLNLLTAVDPALALVSTSPYYCGEGVRSSARAHAYRRKCGADFHEFCELWKYADSLGEWRRRVDDAYESFKALAAERGVSPGTVEEHFEPEDTVLNPVRLRECQPTVEWRAPDAALPSEVLQLATDVRRLVEETEDKPVEVGAPGVYDDHIGVPEYPTLCGLSRAAINFGLEPTPVREYLDRLGFDSSAYDPLSPKIAGPKQVSESEARRIRLEQATRFETDVATLTRPEASPRTTPNEEV